MLIPCACAPPAIAKPLWSSSPFSDGETKAQSDIWARTQVPDVEDHFYWVPEADHADALLT